MIKIKSQLLHYFVPLPVFEAHIQKFNSLVNTLMFLNVNSLFAILKFASWSKPPKEINKMTLDKAYFSGLTSYITRLKEAKKPISLTKEEGARIPPASLPFVPPVAGLLMAGEIIRTLANKE